MESATWRRIERARHLTLQHDALSLPFNRAIRHRRRGEERLSIGVQGLCIQADLRRDLDDPAEVHNGNPIA